MLNRRDLLLGAPLIAASAGAYALTPRQRMNLLGERKLDTEIPTVLGEWEVTPSNAMVLPDAPEGSLSAQLYDETVSRLYTSPSRIPVMLVIAYGSTQSDTLQLHRPEVCYRAVGFEVSGQEAVQVDLQPRGSLPARELVARANERVEPILYWTRIGDFLPTSGTEQRIMKLRNELNGFVADGVLVRLSTVAEPSPQIFAELHDFTAQMMRAVSPEVRPALIGRPLAQEMQAG